MRRCGKCGVDFSGELERCPLCQAPLSGEASPSPFPEPRFRRSGALALRVLAFVTGLAVLAMVAVAGWVGLPRGVALASCLALLISYAFVRHVITHGPGFLRVVSRYFLVLMLIAVLLFLLTGSTPVATFVVPAVSAASIVTDAVLVCVFRGSFVSDHAKYLLLDVALGFVPLAMTALGLTSHALPAQICALLSSAFLLALLVFERRSLLEELRKLLAA